MDGEDGLMGVHERFTMTFGWKAFERDVCTDRRRRTDSARLDNVGLARNARWLVMEEIEIAVNIVSYQFRSTKATRVSCERMRKLHPCIGESERARTWCD